MSWVTFDSEVGGVGVGADVCPSFPHRSLWGEKIPRKGLRVCCVDEYRVTGLDPVPGRESVPSDPSRQRGVRRVRITFHSYLTPVADGDGSGGHEGWVRVDGCGGRGPSTRRLLSAGVGRTRKGFGSRSWNHPWVEDVGFHRPHGRGIGVGPNRCPGSGRRSVS